MNEIGTIQRTTADDIGNALREKGVTNPLTLGGAADAIREIDTEALGRYVSDTKRTLTAKDLQGATAIGKYCFYYTDLAGIELPSTVEYIDECAFCNCWWLEDVKLNQGLRSIGLWAFESSMYLPELYIPSSVTHIESNAFDYTDALTDIYIDKPEGSIAGAPWGAYTATVHWNTPFPY